jgi:hypothetical protein
MKWITRANANVDRVACPWLIKRFVDSEAEFFPYDVLNVELGHVDGRCSFAQDVGISPQSAGLSAIARGFALLHGEADHEKIRLESPMYDALYRWCQSH